MKFKFGVSSNTPSNTKLSNGYTLYDWVMRQRCFPAFWGRPISGNNAITKEEIAFLKDKGCKILLLFNDFTEAQISSNNGENDALQIVEKIHELGVPQWENIAVAVDIPSEWSVNHNWMLGFATVLNANGIVPAFIGNTDSSKNFNFDRQSSHYVQAFGSEKPFETIFGAKEPKVEGEPTTWTPFAPSALVPEDIKLWECGKMFYHDIELIEQYIINDSILDYMW